MTLPLLRDDSLITIPGGAAVRISLPWIRSLPLTSLQKPIVTIDGVRADEVTVVVGDRRVLPAELTEDDGWWFQQDRVALAVPQELASGAHDVAVEFGLRIPYLQVGPDGPLTLPFHAALPLVVDAPPPVVMLAPNRLPQRMPTIPHCPRVGCSARAPSTGLPR